MGRAGSLRLLSSLYLFLVASLLSHVGAVPGGDSSSGNNTIIMATLSLNPGFSLELPIPCTAGNAACSVGHKEVINPVGSFQLIPYFYVNNGALIMRADTNGTTAPFSFYARTELRHNYLWSMLTVGTASMTVSLAIDVLPTQNEGLSAPSWLFSYPSSFPRNGAIVIGQIKGLKGGEIELRYEVGYVFLYVITCHHRPTQFYLLRDSKNQSSNIPIGAVIQYRLFVNTTNNLVQASVTYTNATGRYDYFRSVAISKFYNFFNSTNLVTFKVGAYVQVHTKVTTATGVSTPRVGSGYGQISLRSIAVSFGRPG